MEIAMDEMVDNLIAKRRLRFRFMRHDGWENALFVHWPVDPDVLKKKLPSGLEPDIAQGRAWIGLVLLTERGVSVSPKAGRSYLPHVDHFGANIRTYVKRGDTPGIYFFSLECSSYFASLGARLAGIPYFPARMSRTVDIEYPLANSNVSKRGRSQCGCFQLPEKNARGSERSDSASDADFVFEFASERVGCKSPAVTARWRLRSEDRDSGGLKDELANFFVERYSVYAAWPWGKGPLLLRGDVQHPPWPLQSVALDDLDATQLIAAAGFPELALTARYCGIGNQPHTCFSRGVGPVDFWMLEPC